MYFNKAAFLHSCRLNKTKMNMHLRIIFLFFILSGLTTCKKEVLEPTIIVANIEREFVISYVEKFSKSGRHLQFEVSTIKNQPCGNYTVKTSWQQSPSLLSLNIDGIEKSNACIGNAAIAKGSETAQSLSEGSWPIDIKIQNIIRNPGKLSISKGGYQLILESTHGLSLIQKELKQIPSGTIWGTISYKPEYAATARVFIEDLKKLTKNNPLNDGEYGYFSIQNEIIKFRDTPGDLSALPIVRNQSMDVDLMLHLVNTYRSKHKENILIQLSDTNGITY
jgi:hypothetical protein